MKTPAAITHSQNGVLAMLEELGAAASLLRESAADFQAGNIQGSKIVADDAAEIMGRLERLAAESAARLIKWTNAD